MNCGKWGKSCHLARPPRFLGWWQNCFEWKQLYFQLYIKMKKCSQFFWVFLRFCKTNYPELIYNISYFGLDFQGFYFYAVCEEIFKNNKLFMLIWIVSNNRGFFFVVFCLRNEISASFKFDICRDSSSDCNVVASPEFSERQQTSFLTFFFEVLQNLPVDSLGLFIREVSGRSVLPNLLLALFGFISSFLFTVPKSPLFLFFLTRYHRE